MSQGDDSNGNRDLINRETSFHAASSRQLEIRGLTSDSTIAGAVITAHAVQHAISILDQLTDLGKSLPFVAPAFVVLKIIIDIEAKAREADAKCNDLLERITFMLGHLPVLRRIQVMDATRQVISNMNDVLKTAASLIQAYRRQGRVARRLNSYRDKFDSCAQAINACCNDLMMSLQIHQSGQLDILTRSVPVDAEDEATKTFLADHGGIEAVKADPKLVTQFARELHLSVDDKVMEQINSNITNVMQQNQAQFERTLNESVNAAVIDGLKELAAQMNDAGKEQVFKCVQCNRDFRNSTNGPNSCTFHRAEYSSWNKAYPCCSTSHPCQFQSHRAVHHCDYPYSEFFPRARNVLNYTDTVDDWASVDDTNLENDDTSNATIGRLLRWVSRSEPLGEPTILITVGTVWHSKPYFFDTFTSADLEVAANIVHLTRTTTIFRTSSSKHEFAMAEWILSRQGTITGVRLTAKVVTSEEAHIQVCHFDAATCAKSGEILTLSEGGLRYYKPVTPYVVPKTVRVSPELYDKPLRSVRTDFKTRTSPNLPVILKVVSDPPLKANPRFANTKSDFFQGAVSVFNKHPADSSKPITIASISASFRLVGDPDYAPVESLKVLDDCRLPVTIEPRQSLSLAFEAVVQRPEKDIQHDVKWWYRAFIARNQPLRLRLTLHDIEDEECSLVFEYVYNPFPLEKSKEDDLGFFYFDDPELWLRYSIRVTKSANQDGVVAINGNEIDTKRLQKVVYHAIKNGETEVDLKIGREKDGIWGWEAWALVDASCNRVYAFKILLKQGHSVARHTFGCLGYVLCPDYGDSFNESRPIRYAVEQAKLPDLGMFDFQEFVTDDTIDDITPDPPKPTAESTAAAPSASSSQAAISQDLNQRLGSIDSSLLRIATALEQLVDVLAKSRTS